MKRDRMPAADRRPASARIDAIAGSFACRIERFVARLERWIAGVARSLLAGGGRDAGSREETTSPIRGRRWG